MNALVLISGGIDSTSCAYYLKSQGHRIRPIFVDYGQKAAGPELVAADNVCRLMGLDLCVLKANLGQSFGSGEIKGRNAFLILSAMLSRSFSNPCLIGIGIHAGTPYYDCTEGFLNVVDRLVSEYTDGTCHVVAPFLSWSKLQIWNYFNESGLPAEQTYSCESGRVPPCGGCTSCRQRDSLT